MNKKEEAMEDGQWGDEMLTWQTLGGGESRLAPILRVHIKAIIMHSATRRVDWYLPPGKLNLKHRPSVCFRLLVCLLNCLAQSNQSANESTVSTAMIQSYRRHHLFTSL